MWNWLRCVGRCVLTSKVVVAGLGPLPHLRYCVEVDVVDGEVVWGQRLVLEWRRRLLGLFGLQLGPLQLGVLEVDVDNLGMLHLELVKGIVTVVCRGEVGPVGARPGGASLCCGCSGRLWEGLDRGHVVRILGGVCPRVGEEGGRCSGLALPFAVKGCRVFSSWSGVGTLAVGVREDGEGRWSCGGCGSEGSCPWGPVGQFGRVWFGASLACVGREGRKATATGATGTVSHG